MSSVFSGRALLSKLDLVMEDDNLFKSLWWALMPGDTVTLPWPRGWTDLDHLGTQVLSSDPNDHYRPWLEKNVGRHGWDWNWRVALDGNLIIKFRKGKQQAMVEFAMRWG